MYGIRSSDFKKLLYKKEIDSLKDMGVKIMTNMVIGKVLSVDELLNMGYESVFIGSGAGLPRFMGIEEKAL